MKKYVILILSFIISLILFFILISIQKQSIDKSKLYPIYILKNDVITYENISKENVEVLYTSQENILKYSYISDLNELDSAVTTINLKSGDVIYKTNLIDKSELEQYIKDNSLEKICIKLKDTDSLLGTLVNENRYINLYITINSKYVPKNINEYMVSNLESDKNSDMTFKYFSNIKPVMWIDDVGKKYDGTDKINSIIMQVTKEQAIYLNSIKDIAEFKITLN